MHACMHPSIHPSIEPFFHCLVSADATDSLSRVSGDGNSLGRTITYARPRAKRNATLVARYEPTRDDTDDEIVLLPRRRSPQRRAQPGVSADGGVRTPRISTKRENASNVIKRSEHTLSWACASAIFFFKRHVPTVAFAISNFRVKQGASCRDKSRQPR